MESILSFIGTAVAILMVFGLAVFVHEFGHMIFALIRGVGVESFAIGMGPKIVAWRWHGIEWSLRWFPVGGFVKLKGMPLEEDEEEKPAASTVEGAATVGDLKGAPEKAEEVDDEEERKSLAESSYDDLAALKDQGLITKLMVFGGGVFMNYVTAIVAMFFLLMVPKQIPDFEMALSYVESGSLAEQIGLQADDRIVQIAGEPIQYSSELDEVLSEKMSAAIDEQGEDAEIELSLVVERNGERVQLKTPPLSMREIQNVFAGSQTALKVPPVVESTTVPLPAEKAGIEAGDRIVAIDGNEIEYFSEISRMLNQLEDDEPVTITVERDGEQLSFELVPMKNPQNSGEKLIGIEAAPQIRRTIPGVPPLRALVRAPGETWNYLLRLIDLHVEFFARATLKEVGQGLGGPVLIARLTAQAVDRGIVQLLDFFILLNLLLLVFNLLPLPVLDGGFILLSLIEAAIGRTVPERILGPVFMVFMVLLIGLMVLITVLDFKRWLF